MVVADMPAILNLMWNKQNRCASNVKRSSQSLVRSSPTRQQNYSVSVGWLSSFLHRHRFVYRRVTTTAQKPPENYAEAVAKFIVHLEQRGKAVKFDEVFAMDETAVWFDCPSSRCIDSIGAKDVTIVTTVHEKMRITVCLTARSDRKKLIPYVLVDRKRPISKIEK
uniref:HTH CENPB-type domain-containing protein n=1 Tax=Ditylenchus dipsaci TaxID=166011 RepID=A0A915EME8_9BILA